MRHYHRESTPSWVTYQPGFHKCQRESKYLPLDEDGLVRGQAAHVLPLVLGAIEHRERLAISVRVAQDRRGDVGDWIDALPIRDSERMIEGRMVDGPPQIDDLEALVNKLLRLLWRKVSVNSSDRGFIALIDVGSFVKT